MFIKQNSVTVFSPKAPARPEEAPIFQIAGETHRMQLTGEVEPAILSRLSHPEDCFSGLSQVKDMLLKAEPRLAQARQDLSNGQNRVQVDLGKDSPWSARLSESGALELRSPVHQISSEQCVRIYQDQVTVCTSPLLTDNNAAHEIQGLWSQSQGTLTRSNEEIDYTREVRRPATCHRFTPLVLPQDEPDSATLQCEFAPQTLFQSLDDERLQHFVDRVLSDPELRSAAHPDLSGLPVGWQRVGELGEHSQLFAENYVVSSDNGSFQALSIFPHDGSVKLVNSQQLDERNSSVVVLTRDPEGHTRRCASRKII